MVEPIEVLRSEFGGLAIARQRFPMWTQWGVADESVAVHSLGLSYLTTIGQSVGYPCCCEFPVSGYKVRADSVWWDPESRRPVALFEFERHKGGDELRGKVRNLLRAYHSLAQAPRVLCLVYWTKNFYPMGADGFRELWHVFEHGFVDEDRHRTPPASARLLRVFECLHERVGSGCHTLKAIIERRRP